MSGERGHSLLRVVGRQALLDVAHEQLVQAGDVARGGSWTGDEDRGHKGAARRAGTEERCGECVDGQ